MYRINQLPGRTVLIEGEEWLYFSGTAYLGVVQDAAFQALVHEGIDRYGVHYGGSRLASVRLPLFEEAEELLCRLTGAPAALIVSSGTLAGQLAVRVLGQGAEFRFAPGVHPALWPEGYEAFGGTFEEWVSEVGNRKAEGGRWKSEIGNRKAEGGNPAFDKTTVDTGHRASRLRQRLRRAKPASSVEHQASSTLLTNALDATYARPYDFGWLRSWPSGRPVTLIVDDSHGLGITGAEGGGIYSRLEAPPHVEIVVISSLGKAFGIPAGVILGSKEVVQRIAQSPFFGGASPTAPAFLHAFVHGQEIYKRNRKQLRVNVHHFRERTAAMSLFQSFDHYPVFYTPHNEIAPYLAERRVLVSSFPYPTPDDAAVTRVVINALHREEDIDKLGSFLDDFAGL